MRSPLCDAVARCHLRRLSGAAAAAPLPALLLVVVVVLAPLAFVRIGRAVGAAVAGAAAVDGVAEALVVGPVLAAAMAGAALAVSLPGRSVLGQQVAAAPCGRAVAVVALLLVPVALGGVVLGPALVATCIAAALAMPGGFAAGVALALAVLAAVPAGAVLGEGALAAARGRLPRLSGVILAALLWVLVGRAAGATPLGPLAPVAPALVGSAPPWRALAAVTVSGVALTVAWLGLATTRPEERARKPRHSTRVGRAGRLPLPAALGALLSRRGDVRLATAASLAFGAVGLALAASADAPAEPRFLLATTTSLFGAILPSLVACGVLLDGRWLWQSAPAERRTIVAAAEVVGLAGAALPTAVVGATATLVAVGSWSSVGVVCAFVVTGSALAQVAGALVPWDGDGVADQLTTFAALAAVAVGASIVVGLIGPRLVVLGLPDQVVVALVCAAAVALASCALRWRLGATPR